MARKKIFKAFFFRTAFFKNKVFGDLFFTKKRWHHHRQKQFSLRTSTNIPKVFCQRPLSHKTMATKQFFSFFQSILFLNFRSDCKAISKTNHRQIRSMARNGGRSRTGILPSRIMEKGRLLQRSMLHIFFCFIKIIIIIINKFYKNNHCIQF